MIFQALQRLPRLRAALATLAALGACGCGGAPNDLESAGSLADGAEDLTSTGGVERPVQFQSYVYVPVDATDEAIGAAIGRQVKTGLGALRASKVGLRDRGAAGARVPAKWTRESVLVVDPKALGAPPTPLLRVRFSYEDRAVVARSLDRLSSTPLTLLFGSYAAKADLLRSACSDDPRSDTESLWYHFAPAQPACRALQATEASALRAERQNLGADTSRIGPVEVSRTFVPLALRLGPPAGGSATASPEYDRLFGLDDARGTIQVYAFFGVDSSATDPNDALGREAVTFFRQILRSMPGLRVVDTQPFAMLLDVFVDGQKLEAVTYDRLTSWILGEGAYPAALGNDPARILAFRKQCLEKLTERAIELAVPVSIVRGTATFNKKLSVRFFYGYEDGSAEARQRARWRYLEAFWHGDAFLYNGHSHFGHGPLEPTAYSSANFNARYQVMLVNSCLSYNYYHDDFFAMKPGGTKNLDKIVNGLPSSVLGSGAVTAALLTGLFDGKQSTYATLLGSMQIAAPRQMEALRLVDGELDNAFSQRATPLTLRFGAPLY